MDFITAIIAVFIILSSIYYFWPKNRELLRIPGPSGHPIIGNALQLEPTGPHHTLMTWAKQYGDIMRVNLFGEDIIVANSYEAITEVMLKKSNDFAGRPFNYRSSKLFTDDDIITTDMNPKWSSMKKAAMTGLKQVGDQVTDLEDILQEYLEELAQDFTKRDGKTTDVQDPVTQFVNHVTFTLVHGTAIPADQGKAFAEINNNLGDVFNPTSEYSSLDTLPFLRGFWYSKYKTFMEIIGRYRSFFKKQVTKTIDNQNDEIKCALDGLIEEMKNPSIVKISPITVGNVEATAMNLTSAGVMTTSSALHYFISLMAVNPGLQNEAHEQIIKIIGHRTPSLQDRFSIPYVEAMILEMLRLMSHVPVSIPHKALKDTTLLGYKIPKGTQIWPNLWFLHHDERLWEDPWEFKPKRFLDEEGNLVKADHPLRKQFYAFGAGRRVCIGESLAKYRMFLFVVSILQKFEFVEPKREKLTTDPRKLINSFALRPLDCKVQIKVRQ